MRPAKRIRVGKRLVKVAPRGLRSPTGPSLTVTADRSGNIVRIVK